MYEIIYTIIGKVWETAGDERQYIFAICGALICLFSVLTIDFVKDIFSGFFRG